MPEVCLDTLSQGKSTRDVDRAYIRGPVGLNAIPHVMTGELAEKSSLEVVSLSDVDGVPVPVRGLPAEDVDAREGIVVDPDRV